MYSKAPYSEFGVCHLLPGVDKNNGFEYGSKETPFNLIGKYPKPGRYGNEDLPNLRAAFVKESLLRYQTRGNAKVRFHILDGFVYDQEWKDGLRMAQVYVVFHDQ